MIVNNNLRKVNECSKGINLENIFKKNLLKKVKNNNNNN